MDIEPVIDGRSLAISDDLVFFRTREADAGIRQTVLVSLTSGYDYANSSSDTASISETGTQVAFRSVATNLVSGDTNATYDVFVRDRDVDRDGIPEFGQTNTIRVSVSTVGTQANGPSQETAISDSGRFVAFASAATNLVASDTNGVLDYFVRDRDSDADGLFDEVGGVATTRISVSTAGLQANGGPSTGSLGISGNGRFIVFASQASNLVSGDTNGQPDVFLRDRDTDADNLFDEAGAVATTRISVATDGTQANDYSFEPRISDDGRHVCFFSAATNLAGTDANGIAGDVYVRDRDTDRDDVLDEVGAVATVRVSVSSDGVQPLVGASSGCDISDDGQIVAFQSSATTLVGGDTNGNTDIFAYDRDVDGDGIYDEPGAISTRRVSVASTGIQGAIGGYAPRLNSDGRFVAFASASTNLVGGDANGSDDAFLHDRTSGVTERLSIDNNGFEASNLFSNANPEAAGDSRDTAFQFGGNLGISDLNGFGDIYDRGIDRSAGFCSRDVTGDCDFSDTVLRVLDTRVVSPTPLLLGNASRAAVAAGNAIFLDPVNRQLKLYRDRALPVVNLLSPGIEVAASNTFVAGTFYEGVDSYNGDFDFFDPVAMIAQVATASAFNLVIPALAAERLQLRDTLDGTGVSSYDALEGVAAFVTAESLQGDLDVTQDGESADRTLSVVALDTGATVPTATQFPVVDSQSRRQPIEDFVLGSEIVAFRTRENAFCDNSFGPNTGPACASECPSATPQASCGGATTYSCDLNCDGDCCDDVLNTFDLVAAASGSPNALVSSGRTAEPCRLEACDPREPYKVIGSTVRFLEDERQQEEDLNNDGDATDLVVQVFNVRQGAVRAISAVRPSAPSEAKVGPNPLDPGSAGGNGGGGSGGGMVAVTDGRCIANTSTSCSACDNGEFCGSNGPCQHDYGTCRTNADCPVGTAAVCDTALVYTAAASDRDGDSLPDPVDNCPRDTNLDQYDADGDGVGDARDFETCGNSLVELTEECDDGDTQSGDGCSSACRIESGPCDDGVDNDGDGLVDFGADPGCKTAASPKENPRCDDGIDNDGDGKADWDGAGLGPADPQCAGKPELDGEASSCGLGAELVLVLAVLLRRRARVG